MKKGFIFSFDSFLALIIFTLFTILIYIFFIFSSPTTQQYYFSEDILNTLNSVKISDLDLNYYPNIQTMVTDGGIHDTSSTILEQMLSFELQDKSDDACTVFTDVTKNLLPEGYKIGFDLTSGDICGEVIDQTINLISRNRIAIGKIQA